LECAVPANVFTSHITGDFVKTNWDVATGANFYTIKYRFAATSDPFTWKVALNNRKWLVNLMSGSGYEFQVRSNCDGGLKSSWAALSYFTTDSCGTPSGVNAGNIQHNAAKFNWTTVIGATFYQIRYKVAGTSIWTIKTTYNSSGQWLVGLLAASQYDFQMRAKCSYGYSSWTVIDNFTTLVAPRLENGSDDGLSINLYPNPAKEQMTVEYNLANAEKVELTIFDLYGRLVFYKKEDGEKGKNYVDFYLDNLSSGFYLLEIRTENEQIVKRFGVVG
jgi:hypothetical protein